MSDDLAGKRDDRHRFDNDENLEWSSLCSHSVEQKLENPPPLFLRLCGTKYLSLLCA